MSDTFFAPDAVAVSCPTCATRVPCYDAASSRYFGCPSCRTYFEATPGVPARAARRLDQFRKPSVPGPALQLGSVGMLGGYRCRVAGYQVRSEKEDKTAEWREYQLRPVAPFMGDDPADFPLQLAEYQGHWLLIRRATFVVKSRDESSWEDPDGRVYERWHYYQPVVRDAQGEFDWNILDDERLHIREFVSPPYLLVREQASSGKPAWYRAEHLELADLVAAFQVRADRLPIQYGIGAAQPGRAAGWPHLRRLVVLAGLLLLAAVALGLVLRPPTEVLRQQLTISAPGTGSSQVLTTQSFAVAGPTALAVELQVPNLANHWVEVTASLVNEQTGQGYEFTRSVEYYAGYEGGEHWSEGSTSVDAVLSRVPTGRYHFNLYPTLDAGLPGADLLLLATEHTFLWSNLWLALLLLASVPTGVYFWRRSFEAERWQQSEFNPYASSDD